MKTHELANFGFGVFFVMLAVFVFTVVMSFIVGLDVIPTVETIASALDSHNQDLLGSVVREIGR